MPHNLPISIFKIKSKTTPSGNLTVNPKKEIIAEFKDGYLWEDDDKIRNFRVKRRTVVCYGVTVTAHSMNSFPILHSTELCIKIVKCSGVKSLHFLESIFYLCDCMAWLFSSGCLTRKYLQIFSDRSKYDSEVRIPCESLIPDFGTKAFFIVAWSTKQFMHGGK